MNAKPIVSIAALTLTVFSTSSVASEPTTPAWQEPGYVMEVVIAKTSRPSVTQVARGSVETPLAWQEPGYVEEVVVVTASRSEALEQAAARRERWERWLERSAFLGRPQL